ncbi:MAG TPA: hypothetical protein PLQ85_04940 [Anaerolineae bacterium]|nr:hypothetical protein [Anaerolineae bacterium]
MTGAIPMCRNCRHGEWVPSRGGKRIKRNTAGQCGKADQLVSMALRVVMSPAIEVRVAKRPIWPDDKAHRCPLYEVKPAAVAATTYADTPRPAAACGAEAAGVCTPAHSVRQHTLRG